MLSANDNIKDLGMISQLICTGISRTFEKGGTARCVVIVDVGVAGTCSIIVCEAQGYAKPANTRGSGGMPQGRIQGGSLGSGDPLPICAYFKVSTLINYFIGAIQLRIQLTRL